MEDFKIFYFVEKLIVYQIASSLEKTDVFTTLCDIEKTKETISM
jgi:hypothetical protein